MLQFHPPLNETALENTLMPYLSISFRHSIALSQFSFVVTVASTQRILAHTRWLSVKLQGHYDDVARAHKGSESIKAVLNRNFAMTHNYP